MTLLLSLFGLLAVAVLTAGTAMSVASEFSLTALERSQVDAHAAAAGDRRARSVQRAHRTLSFQLSGCQLGITVTTLATGYIAEPAIAELINPGLQAAGVPTGLSTGISTVLSLVIATALSMVFGELVPKNLAIAHPLGTARKVVWIQAGFAIAFRWLIRALNASANAIVRKLGVEPAEELRSARSPHELSSLVRSSAEHGTIDQGTATLLDRSLRFTDRVADELMTPRVRMEILDGDDTVADLLTLSRRSGFSRFPVQDGDPDVLLGLVHVKQAFGVPVEQRAGTALRTLTVPVETVPGSLDGDALMTRLRASGLQMAVVVDEYGGTAGLVTLEDLIEEIVGDIADEHDPRGDRAHHEDDGSWTLSGLLRPDEVAEHTGVRLPEGDFDSLGGLVLDRLGRVPRGGETVTEPVDGHPVHLTVQAMDGWRVDRVAMRVGDTDE